ANVHYFLACWWENQEDSCLSFEAFQRAFLSAYADDAHIRQAARHELARRAQKPGETCFDYCQVILRLCRLADPQMTEIDKVGHLLKGIAKCVCLTLLLARNAVVGIASVSVTSNVFVDFDKRIVNSGRPRTLAPFV